MQSPLRTDNGLTIYALSETALTVQFDDNISEETLQRISSLNDLLQRQPFPGLRTTVPAYTTLSIFYDALQVMHSDMPGKMCFEKVSGYLNQLPIKPSDQAKTTGTLVTIPVRYGGSFGPDIEEVALYNKLSTEQVIQLHSQAIYKVYMIGFVPGFAYLGGMDAQLATPRKSSPRQTVPAGSVGIAGQQTGIYPMQTPGGWQLIGQTPLAMFDADCKQPALLKAGDEVKFLPIDPNQIQQYRA